MGDLRDDLLEVLYNSYIKIFKYKKFKLSISNNKCVISRKNNNLWTVIDEIDRRKNTGLRKLFLGEKESNYMYYRRVTNKFIERVKGY
jgi:hypothetical protein